MSYLIAYFDILGYKQFLQNDPLDDKVKEVFEIIKNAPREATQFEKSKKLPTQGNQISKHLNYLHFSDTIIVSIPIDENRPAESLHRSFFIGLVSLMIAQSMFDNGLPVRGAIAIGQLLVDMPSAHGKNLGALFAGKASLEALELSDSLEFSGVVYSEQLCEKIEDWTECLKSAKPIGINAKYPWDDWFPIYSCPRKNPPEINTRIVDWYTMVGTKGSSSKEMVETSFKKHGKALSDKLTRKIENTANLIDFSKARFE